MSVVSCTFKRDCAGSDFPITNYSAEGAEQFGLCFSLYFPQSAFDGGCISVCAVESNGPTCDPATQNAADICALQQAAECPPGSERHLFCNIATTCSCVSAGNAEFFYTTPAGTFCAETQEAADALAHSYACSHCSNPATSVQIGALDACTCLNHTYAEQIGYTGQKPIVWAVTSGALPTGLTLNTITGVVSGTTTVAGEFTFTITAYLASGDYGTRTMTISVIEITTTALDDFELGVPYSFQLQATGGSGNYAWKVASGTLPDGLTLFSSGLISGTPTAAGTATVTFQVIDLNCDAINRTYFTPLARVTGKSRTTIATILGYPEFPGFTSSPPKKYKTATWNGYSEQTAVTWTDELPCGGARYDFIGVGAINDAGQQISNYSKNFSAQCLANPRGPRITSIPNFGLHSMFGYCWTADPASCSVCPGTPFNLVGNVATNTPFNDGSDLLQSRMLQSSATHAACSTGSRQAIALDPAQVTNFPNATVNGFFGHWVILTSTNDYSVTLSDEYTDAIALANATIYNSNGLVAQSKPRTTGFVSTWTTVDYTVHCSNLLNGEDYVAIVYLAGDDGSVTTVPFQFTATGATHDLTGTVPTPANGHTTVVRGATISYAT